MQFKELDLVFFSRHNDDPVTYTIQQLSQKRFGKNSLPISHVGIVVSKKVLSEIDTDELYLLESTLSTHNIMLSKLENVRPILSEYRFGVQIRPLKAILEACVADNITVYHRQLNSDTSDKLTSTKSKMDDMYGKYRHSKYTRSPLSLTSAFFQKCSCCHAVDTISIQKSDISPTVFSSQFVTIVLQYIGILPISIISAAMMPVELAQPSISDDSEFKELYSNTHSPCVKVNLPDSAGGNIPSVMRRLMTKVYAKYVKQLLKIVWRETITIIKHSKLVRKLDLNQSQLNSLVGLIV